MRRRWVLIVAAAAVLAGAVAAVPVARAIVVGKLRGEPFGDDYRPLGYHADQLADADPGVRRKAMNAVARFRDRAAPAAPALAAIARNPAAAEDERELALATLTVIGSAAAETTNDLARLLLDPSVKLRIATASALAAFGPAARDASPLLRNSLRDGSPAVRRQAFEALLRVDPDAVAAALRDVLQSPDAGIRADAARFAGSPLGPRKELEPDLWKLAEDPDPAVRRAAGEALPVRRP